MAPASKRAKTKAKPVPLFLATEEDANCVAKACSRHGYKTLPFPNNHYLHDWRWQHLRDIRNGKRPPEWIVVRSYRTPYRPEVLMDFPNYLKFYQHEAVHLHMDAPAFKGSGFLRRCLMAHAPKNELEQCQKDVWFLGPDMVTEAKRLLAQDALKNKDEDEGEDEDAADDAPATKPLPPTGPDLFAWLDDDTLDLIIAPSLDTWRHRLTLDLAREDPRTAIDQGVFWDLSLVCPRWSASCRRALDARFLQLVQQLDGKMTVDMWRALRDLFSTELYKSVQDSGCLDEEGRMLGNERFFAKSMRLYERWCFALLPVKLATGGRLSKRVNQHPLVEYAASTGPDADPWLRRVATVVFGCYGLLTGTPGTHAGELVGYVAVTKDYHDERVRRLATAVARLSVYIEYGNEGFNVNESMHLFTRVLETLANRWIRVAHGKEGHEETTKALGLLRKRRKEAVGTRSMAHGVRGPKDVEKDLWFLAPDAYAQLASAVLRGVGA